MENEKKTIGFITVRTSSSRLPRKCLLPFGETTVISHIIRRAISYNIEPIVCTSMAKDDDIIEKIANQEGVNCFRGSLKNKLKRWLDCALHHNIESFHTIDADDPFFDGNEIKRSMDLLIKENQDMICPTNSSSSGGGSVGYSLKTDIIKKACNLIDDNTNTEMMWYFLEQVSGIKLKILPESSNLAPNVRLTLDYEEDYWLLASIIRIVGNNASRDQVINLFLNNPDLHKINFFRNIEWKKSQTFNNK